MGMLIHHHRQRQRAAAAEAEQAKPRRTHRKRGKAPEQPATPAAEQPEASPYAGLDDEQLLEAYATTVPDGEAADRDAMVAELDAAAAEAEQATTDPEDTSGE